MNKQYEKFLNKGYIVKDVHISSCVLDQPHVSFYDKETDREIILMVGHPIYENHEKRLPRYDKRRHKRKHKH